MAFVIICNKVFAFKNKNKKTHKKCNTHTQFIKNNDVSNYFEILVEK